MNVNKLMFAGNLTRDPELRQLPNGTSVCDFTVANNRRYKTSAGEEREDTCFLDCTAWGKTGEIINEHFTQGKEIFIEARLHYETWEAKDGSRRSKIAAVVDNFQFVGKKDAGGGGGDGGYRGEPQEPQRAANKSGGRPAAKKLQAGKAVGQADDDAPPISNDDIPF